MIDKKTKEAFIKKCIDEKSIQLTTTTPKINDNNKKNVMSTWRVSSSGDVFIISGENNA